MADCVQIGTPQRPLRVAIVGAGPSGFHAAMALLDSDDPLVEVDMFDRLPTPYGLVRAGVAPDHQKIKSVSTIYERLGDNPRFGFFGNVALGRDIFVGDLTTHYDQVIYATGNEGDRRLGVPGEHLLGCTPASVFVGWYNGHPDYQAAAIDLSVRRVAIIGNGNVALDVARILLKDPTELAKTDIAEHALLALRRSLVEEVVIIGRRGPTLAAFTPAELKEVLALPNVAQRIAARDLQLDESTHQELRRLSAKTPARRNYELLSAAAHAAPGGAARTLEFRFHASPIEFIGDADGHLIGVVLSDTRANQPALDAPPSETELSIGAAIVAIGFEGKRIDGLPFDAARGTIANADGRVLDPHTGKARPNEYCVGWARTGAKGIIAAQKVGSSEIVERMLADFRTGTVHAGERLGRQTMRLQLVERKVRWVTFEDWEHINSTELVRGSLRGAARSKLVSVPIMLDVIEMKRRGW
jgi:ferredoxin--NADP+ reductase